MRATIRPATSAGSKSVTIRCGPFSAAVKRVLDLRHHRAAQADPLGLLDPDRRDRQTRGKDRCSRVHIALDVVLAAPADPAPALSARRRGEQVTGRLAGFGHD
ncbi:MULTISPECIES: hypothetical protein [Kribbella]|uniref:hypothetical protein n=1 Tax=Kribbella TaxID=182639 RepID=UPI00130542D4|nr:MULTISPECIES: hypothetical protein [Kribbella]